MDRFGVAEAQVRLEQVRRDIAQRHNLLRIRQQAAQRAAEDAEAVAFLTEIYGGVLNR